MWMCCTVLMAVPRGAVLWSTSRLMRRSGPSRNSMTQNSWAAWSLCARIAKREARRHSRKLPSSLRIEYKTRMNSSVRLCARIAKRECINARKHCVPGSSSARARILVSPQDEAISLANGRVIQLKAADFCECMNFFSALEANHAWQITCGCTHNYHHVRYDVPADQ